MRAAPFAIIALVAQAIPVAGLWLIANGCYLEPRRIPVGAEDAVSFGWLLLSTAISWGLAGRASFRLFTECRRVVAATLSVFCCLPGWIGGALYFHSVLIFAGWL
jgi:hypothetical protein